MQAPLELSRQLRRAGERAHLWNQNLVASLDGALDSLAILVQTTWADGEDAGLVQFLDGALWEKDTGGGLALGLDALDEDAIEERGEGLDGLECGRLNVLKSALIYSIFSRDAIPSEIDVCNREDALRRTAIVFSLPLFLPFPSMLAGFICSSPVRQASFRHLRPGNTETGNPLFSIARGNNRDKRTILKDEVWDGRKDERTGNSWGS
jgi:hypothetical protein